MLSDYLSIMKVLKKNVEPMSGSATGKALGLYNTTATSRLKELSEVGLVEQTYATGHIHLWTISYSGKAVLELLVTLDDMDMEDIMDGGAAFEKEPEKSDGNKENG